MGAAPGRPGSHTDGGVQTWNPHYHWNNLRTYGAGAPARGTQENTSKPDTMPLPLCADISGECRPNAAALFGLG